MSMKILLKWSGGEAIARLRDTASSRKLLQVLPFSSTAHTWGDEVYCSAPTNAMPSRQVVPAGTAGFWTEGDCLAIPFGPIPIPVADKCRLAARVNIPGLLEADPDGKRESGGNRSSQPV